MAPPSSSPGLPMHKNRLQEYAQKSGLQLPTYSTINDGFQHAPKFRSTVLVGGTTYTSLLTFSNRKAAEQDAAKLALESVTKKTKDEGYLLLHQDPTICKLILHEFAVKTNMEIPTYTIIQSDDKCPVFVSSLVFGGKTYTGDTCKSKKEAEQLAARTAIQSLLGSGSRNLLNQIINSKFNLYVAVPKLNYPGFSQNVVPITVQPEGSSQHLKNFPVRHLSLKAFKKPRQEFFCEILVQL
ncbi:hypothetical protein L1049_027484 [Liquidambar formosana]|uniref:DRBM domain-containing protein n=1 Tax=Liquidambar formosana TaxID=63359 RepID=A0AAP0WSI8_LIQFO